MTNEKKKYIAIKREIPIEPVILDILTKYIFYRKELSITFVKEYEMVRIAAVFLLGKVNPIIII